MVDLTFLGINAEDAETLDSLPPSQLTALLSAPALPFDGMNEVGLAIGMAAVPESGTSEAYSNSTQPTIGSIEIIREILDHTQTVDEAVEYFETYNIDFGGGPPIHYLIADASGNSVLIEIYEGNPVILPNEEPYHLATNHLRCIADGDGGCSRYRTLLERLSETNGKLDQAEAMQLLSEVAQAGTQWSVVYNMTEGDVSVVIGQAYQNVYAFHLDQMKP